MFFGDKDSKPAAVDAVTGLSCTRARCLRAVRGPRRSPPSTLSQVTKSPTQVSFGPYLQRLMAERGYTTADLSRACGVSEATIGRWIREEKEPALSTLRAAAPHLGVRLGDLIIAAGLATATELGTVGSPPPPRPPLPAQLQRIVALLLQPKITNESKRTLLNAVARAVDMWEEMRQPPKEPRMRRAPR